MNLARVIGSVHATCKDPNVEQATMLIVQPINGQKQKAGKPLVAVDMVGAGIGDIVFFTTAYEAVLPWKQRRPQVRVALIDAGIVGIVDHLEFESAK